MSGDAPLGGVGKLRLYESAYENENVICNLFYCTTMVALVPYRSQALRSPPAMSPATFALSCISAGLLAAFVDRSC